MLRYLASMARVVFRATRHADGSKISRLRRRVRLSECDVNVHMNQGVYARILELGRADWAIRSGSWKRWRAAGIHPVVAEQRIVYRRELKPFTDYIIDTRVVGRSGRLLEFEQHVCVGDRVHTLGQAKLIFLGPDGVLEGDILSRHVEELITEPLLVESWVAGEALS